MLCFLSLQLALFGGGSDCDVAGLLRQMGVSVGRPEMDMASANMSVTGMASMDMAEMASMDMAEMDGMDMAEMDGMDMAEMAGMDMTEMAGSALPTTSTHLVAVAPHDEQSCETEDVSSVCNSMTVCVFAAVTSRGIMPSVLPAPPARMPTLAVRTPPTEGDAPDLPPPRA